MDLLFVEDAIDLQKILAQYLELSGFRVYSANHGKHGLEVFKGHHIDLCILDVMMPLMDGFELAGEIRSIDPAMPIVFPTAKNQKGIRLKGLQIGADDYITKPFEAEELVLRLHNILKREMILEDLWGQNDYFLGRSMDVFISRLRKYLHAEETVSLETKRGVGFIFKVKSHTSE